MPGGAPGFVLLSPADGITPISPSGLLPAGAVITNFGNGTSVAAAVASTNLPAQSGKTNYITGFVVSGLGATAAAVVNVTIAGLLGGTFTIPVPIPAGVTAPVWLPFTFPTPLAASAVNTQITASVQSFGSGNTSAAIAIIGYTL